MSNPNILSQIVFNQDTDIFSKQDIYDAYHASNSEKPGYTKSDIGNYLHQLVSIGVLWSSNDLFEIREASYKKLG